MRSPGLDEPVRRVATAADAAEAAAARLTQAASRAEAAAQKIDARRQPRGDVTDVDPPRRRSGAEVRPTPRPAGVSTGTPIVDPIAAGFTDAPVPKLRGPMGKIVGLLLLLAIGGGGYGIYWKIQQDRAESGKNKKERDELQKKLDDDAAARQKDLEDKQVDPGSLHIVSNPGNAGVWLNLGKTPLRSMTLSAKDTHELALTHDGYDAVEVQVTADKWTTDGKTAAHVSASMQPHTDPPPKRPYEAGKDPTRPPLQSTPLHKSTGLAGAGPIAVESTPPGADVWLFLGAALPTAQIDQIPAGRAYQVLVQKPKFKPKYVAIAPDDWRVPGDTNPNIDAAKKKDVYDVNVDLEADNTK